jgi:hypothetical protein
MKNPKKARITYCAPQKKVSQIMVNAELSLSNFELFTNRLKQVSVNRLLEMTGDPKLRLELMDTHLSNGNGIPLKTWSCWIIFVSRDYQFLLQAFFNSEDVHRFLDLKAHYKAKLSSHEMRVDFVKEYLNQVAGAICRDLTYSTHQFSTMSIPIQSRALDEVHQIKQSEYELHQQWKIQCGMQASFVMRVSGTVSQDFSFKENDEEVLEQVEFF